MMSVESSPLNSDMANGRTGEKMETRGTPEEAAIAGLIDTFSSSSYTITSRGKDVLNEFGEDIVVQDVLIHHRPATCRIELVAAAMLWIIVIQAKHVSRFMNQGMGIDAWRFHGFIDKVV